MLACLFVSLLECMLAYVLPCGCACVLAWTFAACVHVDVRACLPSCVAWVLAWWLGRWLACLLARFWDCLSVCLPACLLSVDPLCAKWPCPERKGGAALRVFSRRRCWRERRVGKKLPVLITVQARLTPVSYTHLTLPTIYSV